MLSDLDGWWPLDLRDRPGALTPWRLRLLAADEKSCLATLRRSGIAPLTVSQRPLVNGCGYTDGVAPAAFALALDKPPVMRCALAATYAAWERHVVQPAAKRRLGSEVREISHFGAYSCRDIRGRPGRRSQHATANAIDISGFTLANGRQLTLSRDWKDDGAEGRFLREIRDGACGLFVGVLSPDWNAAHADHFHLDMGRFGVCR
ncbi:extensin family protein [Hansschlegelia quercus]|uniref:extensin-like domain-containing protein n=1 Tax=Hansschlegelia quercus TaxID=2528245 RepID=UPI001FE1F069|nr:extensin family protein [Hansschlegelia quercus]